MKTVIGIIIVALLVSSCAPDSRITASWKRPRFRTGYSDVLIAGMTHSIAAKSTIENDLSGALAARGIVAAKSMDLFPANFSKDLGKEEMMGRIRNGSAKAIITVSLIHKETQSHYVPPVYGYPMMYSYYGRFWGYYTYMYPTVYGPGYYEQDRIYYMETNVYDVKTEELVWSAQSETYNPSDLSGFSHNLANIIADKLVADHVLRPAVKIEVQHKKEVSRNRP